MFELQVVGVDEAERLVYYFWPTRVISLTNEQERNYGTHHLHIYVNDIAYTSENVVSPSPEHIVQAIEWTRDLTDQDRLLVHCHAGQSRSTAIAIAICISHGMSYKEAFDHVENIRPILMPNQLFIQHTDDHFNLGGDLIEYAKNHRIASLGKNLILPSGPPPKTEIDNMKRILQLMNGQND